MRTLITGAGGQLGSDLARLLPDASALAREELDVSDARAVKRAFAAVRPQLVLNCAAYNAVDRAETEPELARAVNAEGPRLLAEACARSGVRLVHFSTNFVFGGEAARPYTEEDPPRPLGAYARSKLEGEIAVLAVLPSALVVRSAGLFGVRGSHVKGGSFPERIIARARSGEPVRVVNDQRLNPTFTAHLAAAALEFVESGVTGVVHAVAEGCCSFSELAREALSLAGLEVAVAEISTADLAAPAARPLNGCLASVRVRPLPHWRDGLREWWRLLGD